MIIVKITDGEYAKEFVIRDDAIKELWKLKTGGHNYHDLKVGILYEFLLALEAIEDKKHEKTGNLVLVS